LLIDFFRRLRWNFFFVLLFLTLLSFSVGWFEIDRDFFAAFYLPWNRSWELFAGAFLAYGGVFKKKIFWWNRLPPSPLPSIQSFVGLCLLSIGVLCFDEKTPFPGWAAALPVSGTFLMIASGPQAWWNRVVLSSQPLVGLGRISYSWYLWHWPLLSFVHIVEHEVTVIVGFTVILGSLVLAILTYYAVEKPLRFLKSSPWQAAFLFCLMLGLATWVHA
jgi:hypothetical protein